ncbi:PREDICTED: HAUS augmin-like complex subunit 4 [Priapulus caudatus]|uniref:HAUS augmin-like complex subunit 4 n=1 Tax=Priapulus caudatus TaxID=37621 RepID=A0ABM1E2F3_PRICU|nr:PREDICTED: HAUS augmin-like complex subunit 4 [Priapulus caudatus]
MPKDFNDSENKFLPSFVTDYDLERNPEFAHLLRELGKHMTDKCERKQQLQKLNESENRLKAAKAKYFQQLLIYHELQELLLDHQIVSDTSRQKEQVYKQLQTQLTHSEIADYIYNVSSHRADTKVETRPEKRSTDMLGITKDIIDKSCPEQVDISPVIAELEQRWQEKCKTLSQFHDCSDIPKGNEVAVLGKAIQLPGIVEEEIHQLKREEQALQQDRQKRTKHYWHYYEALVKSLCGLEQIILNHKLGCQARSDAISVERMSARCQALCLKIRLLELQLLVDTYMAENTKALGKIKLHLQTRRLEYEQEMTAVVRALTTYQSVGSGFDEIVEEYGRLQSELENKQWTLKELA